MHTVSQSAYFRALLDREPAQPSRYQSVPSLAHGAPEAWNMDMDQYEPQQDNSAAYQSYQFLGRINPGSVEDPRTGYQAQLIARAKFHPEAKVFRTARWYVAYRIL